MKNQNVVLEPKVAPTTFSDHLVLSRDFHAGRGWELVFILLDFIIIVYGIRNTELNEVFLLYIIVNNFSPVFSLDGVVIIGGKEIRVQNTLKMARALRGIPARKKHIILSAIPRGLMTVSLVLFMMGSLPMAVLAALLSALLGFLRGRTLIGEVNAPEFLSRKYARMILLGHPLAKLLLATSVWVFFAFPYFHSGLIVLYFMSLVLLLVMYPVLRWYEKVEVQQLQYKALFEELSEELSSESPIFSKTLAELPRVAYDVSVDNRISNIASIVLGVMLYIGITVFLNIWPDINPLVRVFWLVIILVGTVCVGLIFSATHRSQGRLKGVLDGIETSIENFRKISQKYLDALEE